MNPQVGIVDEGIRPRTRQQILLGHGLAGALDQGEKDLHRPAAQATDLAALEQDALRGDQPERAERQRMVLRPRPVNCSYVPSPLSGCCDLAPDPGDPAALGGRSVLRQKRNARSAADPASIRQSHIFVTEAATGPYRLLIPPSTISSPPTTNRDSSEAKYTAASAIASGSPNRPTGSWPISQLRVVSRSAWPSPSLSWSGVATGPGLITFVRMPRPISSPERVRASETSPAFDAA